MGENTTQSIAILSISIILWLATGSSTSLSAQQLWPGDINDNGIVNNVDLLFWGIAKGDKGPKRLLTGTAWIPYSAAEDWDDNFLTGLNYAQADADGKGRIENTDKNTILRDNYGETHGIISPDVFLIGNPTTDPSLLVVPKSTTVSPGSSITFDVFLGDAAHPVDHYFGIAFSLSFDANYVADEQNGTAWNPTVVDFNLDGGTWLNGYGARSSNAYVHLNDANGQLDVVLLRKKSGQNSGHGQIASLTIVVEDIVLLQDVNTGITVEKIKLIDDNMIEYPVAGSTEYFTILADNQALVDNNDGPEEESQAAGVDRKLATISTTTIPDEEIRVKLFPNPTTAWLQVDIDPTYHLEEIDIYDLQGHLVRNSTQQNTTQQLIDIQSLPVGNYYLHIHTDGGKAILQFNKTE